MSDEQQPLVSILSPNFNGEEFLADTIEAVLKQSYQNWELILIDDHSKDQSVALIEEYTKKDERIRLMALPQNAGRPAIPRNLGMAEARGEYFAFLDSDDIWHPMKLEIQVRLMQEQGVKFCSSLYKNFSRMEQIQKDLDTPYQFEEVTKDPIKIRFGGLIYKNVIPNSSVVVHKSCFEGISFNEDERYKAIEDFHCWLRIHQKIPHSLQVRAPLLLRRLTEGSISRSKLSMFKKNYILYSEFEENGSKLGLKKYLYLTSYITRSVLDRLIP